MEVKKIKEINIKYIKGIENKSFKFDLFPNKPSIFVAPNGFGKSSFTKAFLCMNQNKIKLENKEDFYKNDENNNTCSEVSINYEGIGGVCETKVATSSSNDISSKFNISVINSSIIPKSKHQNFGSFHTPSKPSLEVPEIILKKTIPTRYNFVYSFTDEKRAFGTNGKVLINITDTIKNYSLILKLLNNEKFKKLDQSRPAGKIQEWVDHINSLNGNKDQIITQIDNSKLGGYFDDFIEIISSLGYSDNENYILVYQLYKLYCSNRSDVTKIKKWYNYLLFKINIKETLESIGTTWKGIKTKETQNKLVLDFPDIRNISNGQRDSIVFLAKILETEEKITSNKALLLIIDEVFDYLDDANLIICQYYVSKFIEKFKQEGKQIFPIIMTHINPDYFKGYVFKNQHVYFLNKIATNIINKDLHKIIFNRKEISIKNKLEKYFLHFHCHNENLENEFESLGIRRDLGDITNFKIFITNEFKNYVAGRSGYDPLSVCTYLRIKIEQFCYNKLITNQDKEDFLNTHRTKEKLNYIIEKGIDIPEIFYLLGVIYNDGMHINKNNDWATPLRSKLDNLFIMNMVKDLNIISD